MAFADLERWRSDMPVEKRVRTDDGGALQRHVDGFDSVHNRYMPQTVWGYSRRERRSYYLFQFGYGVARQLWPYAVDEIHLDLAFVLGRNRAAVFAVEDVFHPFVGRA